LKDKDEIKELFQKELGNYQAKVNPNLWNGIQAGIGTAGAASAVGSSLGFVSKIIIGVSVAAILTVGTVYIVKNKQSVQKENELITEVNAQDSTESETIQSSKVNDIPKHSSSTSGIDFIEKATDKITDSSIRTEKSGINERSLKEVPQSLNASENSTSLDEVILDEKQPDNSITFKEVPPIAPSVDLSEEYIKKEENEIVDLSKVNIQIVEQNNQYINFYADAVPNEAQVLWNFEDGSYDKTLNPKHFFAESGIYNVVLSVEFGNQKVTKRIQVEIQMKGEVGALPNVFTPNGDGYNDEFFIECKNLKSFQLNIMDNNHNVVYSTNDVDFRWNGLDKNGVSVKDGNYVYMIIAEDEAGNIINKYQHLHIQR